MQARARLLNLPMVVTGRERAAKGYEATMNWERLIGGSPLAVAVRLMLISIAVGIVMKALGIDLSNFFQRINVLLRNIYDLGLNAFDWLLEYLLLGALVVIPIWLVARLIKSARPDDKERS